jgi:kynurenine formamidase
MMGGWAGAHHTEKQVIKIDDPSSPLMKMFGKEPFEHGAAKFGVDWLTAHCLVVIGDHIGTHVDSLRHMRDNAPGPEGIPIEYCYGDGVVLDFRHLPKGAGNHDRRRKGRAG